MERAGTEVTCSETLFTWSHMFVPNVSWNGEEKCLFSLDSEVCKHSAQKRCQSSIRTVKKLEKSPTHTKLH